MINKLMYVFLSVLLLPPMGFAQNSSLSSPAIKIQSGYVTVGRLQALLLPKPLLAINDRLLCEGEVSHLGCSDPQSTWFNSIGEEVSDVSSKGIYICYYRGILSPIHTDTFFIDARLAPKVILSVQDTLVSSGTQLDLTALAVGENATTPVLWFDSQENLLSTPQFLIHEKCLLYAYVEDSICNLSDESPLKVDLLPNLQAKVSMEVVNLIIVDNHQFTYFKILNIAEFTEVSLALYTSQGDLIHSSTNYQNDFDMRDFLPGVYYYILKAKDAQGNFVIKNSFVQLQKK